MSAVVGRERELSDVGVFLQSIRDAPGILVIEGEPGIGKTVIWRAAVERAQESGFRVLSCRPVEAEAKLSYAAVADLVSGLPETSVEELPDPQARALSVAILSAEPEGPAPDARTVGTALASLLRRAAVDGPVLVAVDDVQWLDRPSASAVAFAARRLGPARVGMLLTQRTDTSSRSLASALEGGTTDASRILLSGLSVASLFHIVDKELGTSLPRPALLKVEELSEGNPLFALELARTLRDGGMRPGEPLRVPETLTELVAERLSSLPKPTIEALRVAAASSQPRLDVLRTVLGDEPEERLAPAEAAGVVELEAARVRFRHPLFASAVYSSAGAEARRRCHRLLASAVVGDPEEVARHLALAATEPSEEVAAALDAAAARAGARGAPDAAAELGELAARLTPPDDAPSGRRRTIAAAEAFASAGDPERARNLLGPILLEELPPEERGRALSLLGRINWHEDGFPEAIARLQEALLHLGDPLLTAPIRFSLAFAYVSTADPAAALEQARLALEDAEEAGDPGLLAEALAVTAIVEFMSGLGTDLSKLERSLELEDRSRRAELIMRPSSIAAMIAVYEARLAEACGRLHEICSWAFEIGDDAAVPFLLDHLAWAEWWRGDFAASEEAVQQALDLAAQTGSKLNRTAPLVHRAMVHGFRGELDAAFDDIAAATTLFQETGWTFGLSWAATAAGAINVARQDLAAAEEALEPLIAATEAMGVVEPVWALFLPDAVEALAGRGQLDRAERLLDGFEEQASRLGRSWALAESARCRALILAERGELDEALDAIGDALERHEQLELPIERGRALLLLGRIRRRRREKLLAKEALEQAQAVFEGLGAVLWAEQARGELGRVGLRRRSPSALTETEQRVAELAADGRTTKEVAQTLSVSPKTVEAALSRIYGKLEIHSRAELGAWMAKRGERAKT
jgi:DNA-binding CsgD family transcriptional regulator